MKPFMKYTGSKRKLAKWICSNIDLSGKRLVEPFCGSAAVTLFLEPKKAWLNDISPFVIDIFSAIKTDPIRFHKILDDIHTPIYYETDENKVKEAYLAIRSEYYNDTDLISRAVKEFILISMCYNGLVRFDKYGHWNVAFGKRFSIAYSATPLTKHMSYYDVLGYSNMFANYDITCMNYIDVISNCNPETDFIYCDPPYLISADTTYQGKWTTDHLSHLCDMLVAFAERGGKFAISECGKRKDFVNELLYDKMSRYNIISSDYKYTIGNNNLAVDASEILIYN